MSLIDNLKAHLKDDANIGEVENLLKGYAQFTPDSVKEYVKSPDNRSVYDSLVSTAVASHIEKEKASRSSWEQAKAEELLQQARDTIAKESQKPEWQIKMDKLEQTIAEKEKNEQIAILKSNLQSLVSNEKLPIHNVDPFLKYGEDAESQLKDYASKTNEMINDLVKKQIAEKFGSGKMDSGKTSDDKPVSTEDFLKEQFSGTMAGER